MAARPRRGHTRGVGPVSFRVTAAQRAELEAIAAAKGVTVNELARARAVTGLGADDRVTPSGRSEGHRVTPTRSAGPTGNGVRELAVEYDPEVARGQ